MSTSQIKIFSIILPALFVLFMFYGPHNYILQEHHNSVDANIQNTYQYIKKSITYIVNEKKQHYLNTALAIFSHEEIINAIKNKDRDSFYKNIKPYFDRTKKHDKDFWGLHIILPDSISFIRVHKPNVADKLIKKGQKPLIEKVNETRQHVTSFDAGKFGYFLRVVTPIFSHKKEYLGAAEFSVKIDSLTQHIKNNFGFESLFLVKNLKNKNFLNILPKTKNGLTQYKSTNKKLFANYNYDENIKSQDEILHNNLINHEEKNYKITTLKLSETATLVVAVEITNTIKSYEMFKLHTSILIAIVITTFLIVWFLATKFYLLNMKQVSRELEKSHDILSQNVIYSNTDLD